MVSNRQIQERLLSTLISKKPEFHCLLQQLKNIQEWVDPLLYTIEGGSLTPANKAAYPIAYFCVQLLAVASYFARSVLYMWAISGTSGSSGFGSVKSEHIESNTWKHKSVVSTKFNVISIRRNSRSSLHKFYIKKTRSNYWVSSRSNALEQGHNLNLMIRRKGNVDSSNWDLSEAIIGRVFQRENG